ncbi:MAG: biopolymer transporter ExbD [Gammaproteobacteria bacterium]|nr:MAG: biopolymer transporter ExbD [Gammaproteobacteria bacterium]
MRMSRRAKRMERHHKRGRRGSLNIVSLMDIFTILVFFLLVSSTEVEVLPNPRDLTLPESVAEEGARETVLITVTAQHILVQGQVVADVHEVLARDATLIPELGAALRAQTDRVLRRDAVTDAADREVTIMGDKGLPFSLLRQVMATCTDAEYGRISLAVSQRGLAAADHPPPAIGQPAG